MLYLDKIAYYLPAEKINVCDMQESTGANRTSLRIFESFYGLQKIAVAKHQTTKDLMDHVLDEILINVPEQECFDYVVHCHASREVTPFSMSIPQIIQNRIQARKAKVFGTSMLKCVSTLGIFETLSVLMQKSKFGKSLIVTGDIAFTPELRLVPRATICGDAATAAIVQTHGMRNQLLAVETRFLPGYSQGIYVDMNQMLDFDHKFIKLMKDTILYSVAKAGITLNQIALILPHNVNLPTWQKIAAALEIDMNKIYLDQISQLGHCFASDGFLNLSFALEQGLLEKDQYYLMAGCGLGVFFASAVFKY